MNNKEIAGVTIHDEGIDKAIETFDKLTKELGYKNFILSLMKWERGLSTEDLEIDFTAWWESNEGSILNSILAGEEVDNY